MLPPIRVRVDRKRLEREMAEGLRAFERGVTTVLYREADAALAEARKTTLFKDRTGKLRKNIGARYRGLFHVSLEARRPYASFVHDGTRPHIIRARNARFLAFQMNGRMVFRKSVRHPGTSPRPFIANPVHDARDRVEAHLNVLIERSFNNR